MPVRVGRFLTPGSLFKKKNDKLVQWMEKYGVKDYSLFGYGRIALLAGLKILNFDKDGNVLLPSYICDVTAEPFHELGIETRFYKVLDHLQPDIADIRARIDKKTKAILVVNYFGFPQRLDEVRSVCEQHGLAIIEDNAHGFLSRKNSRLLGTLGDIGFSSIWKVLPVPNGAVLYINNKRLLTRAGGLPQIWEPQENVRKASTYIFILNSLLSYLEVKCGFPSRYFRNTYSRFSSKSERNATRDYLRAKVKISGLSLEVMRRVDPDEVIHKRRENYRFWLYRLNRKRAITVIFKDLPEGVCPQLFPIIANDVDGLKQKLLDKGVPVDNWPWLPKEVRGNLEYSTANFLASHLLTLPVHQNTCPDDLEKAIKGLNIP